MACMMDDFRKRLAELSQDISNEDLEVFKYFSRDPDLLSARDIEIIETFEDLCDKLIRTKGKEKCEIFLHYVFSQRKQILQREKLSNISEDDWSKLGIKPLRKFLYEVSEELTSEEWKKFMFLLKDKIRGSIIDKGRLAVLSALLMTYFSNEATLLQRLTEIFKSLNRRDLCSKVDQYKVCHAENPSTLHGAESTSSHHQGESSSRPRQAENASTPQVERTSTPQVESTSTPGQVESTSLHQQSESASIYRQDECTSTKDQVKSLSTHLYAQECGEGEQSLQNSNNNQNSKLYAADFSYDPKSVIDLHLSMYKGSLSKIVVAVKVISKRNGADDILKKSLNECEILRHLEQKNVQQYFLKYYGVYACQTTVCLCLELYECTLKEYMLMKENKLQKEEAIQKCRSLARGVEFLHSEKIIHRAISPDNIFVVEYPMETLFKFGNLGSCERIDSMKEGKEKTFTSKCFDYQAKEVLEEWIIQTDDQYLFQLKYSFRADIFALGCVFCFTLTNGHHPYCSGKKSPYKNILKGCDPVFDELTKSKDFHLIVLIKPMISHREKYRPTAAEVCVHPALWKDDDILEFYYKVSDKLSDKVPKEEPNKEELEKKKQKEKNQFENKSILHKDWLENIPLKELKDCLKEGKNKYDGKRVESLLRAIRNTKSHIDGWPSSVKNSVKEFEGGTLAIWNEACPDLFEHVYQSVKKLKWDETEEFKFMKSK